MQSALLLVLVTGVLAVPGIAASLAAFPPGEVAAPTRLAAAFGLGYAATGGCAFVLAAAHAFRLSVFIPVWLAVSAALWIAALRRASLRSQAQALAEEVGKNRLPLLLGALVIAALLLMHLKFIYLLGGPRYVYYQDGLEIANSGGIPSATLEYGQSWAPATDKIFLDAFTGVVVLLNHTVAIGPGVLLWISTLGAALGLWATGWELGLRRTGGLLPLLVLSNEVFLNTLVSRDFTDYRAEDFGRAVAFCALALGIHAIHGRKWLPAVVAGVVLAAASGTHLIPVVVVAIGIFFAAVAEVARRDKDGAVLVAMRQLAAIAAVSACLGVVIRVFAGGSFGLGGASNQRGYAAIHTPFDPTAYLFSGAFLPRVPPGGGSWYVPPSRALSDIMAGSGIDWPVWGLWLLLAGCLLAAILLLRLAQADLQTVGVVGLGVIAGIVAVALAFSFHYRVYIDATFGVRRLRDFSALGLILLALGLLEAVLQFFGRGRPQLSAGIAAAIVTAFAAWLLPTGVTSQPVNELSHQRAVFINWVRTQTPCDARILFNQRTEGAFTALTGRFALLEGMGPFLRVDKLPYVVNLMLGARRFFQSPVSDEAYLRQHDISYVVVAAHLLLGYTQPPGRANLRGLLAAPFLHLVLASRTAVVFRAVGAPAVPVSPLLKGPYVHCMTTPVRP